MAKTTLIEVAQRAPSNFNKFMKMRLNDLKEKYENHRERFSAVAMEWSHLSDDEKAAEVAKAVAYIATLNEPPKAPRKKRVPIEKVEAEGNKAVKTTRGPSVYNLYISKLMSDANMISEVSDRKERFKAVVKKYSELSDEAKKALAEEFKGALKAKEPKTPPPLVPGGPATVDPEFRVREEKPKKKRVSKSKGKVSSDSSEAVKMQTSDEEDTSRAMDQEKPEQAEAEQESEKPKKKRSSKTKKAEAEPEQATEEAEPEAMVAEAEEKPKKKRSSSKSKH
jgi:hypothetical protein